MAVIWLHESLTVKTIDIPGLPGEMQGLSWKRPALHCPLQPLHGQQLHQLEIAYIHSPIVSSLRILQGSARAQPQPSLAMQQADAD